MATDWAKTAAKRLSRIRELERLIERNKTELATMIAAQLMVECKSREWGRSDVIPEIAKRVAELCFRVP
jgi:hypothetical protein